MRGWLLPAVTALLAWALAAGVAVRVVGRARHHHGFGLDLNPLHRAGGQLLEGHSPYGVPRFVYPPPAAWLGALSSLVPERTARLVMLAAEVGAIALVAAATAWLALAGRRWWPVAAGLLAAALLGADLSGWALWLDNISVLLAPLAAAVVWLFARGRWTAGAVLLGLTLAVKPLLLPLLVIPLLLRAWRVAGIAIAAAAVPVLVSLPLTPGLHRMPGVARRLVEGSELVGARVGNNLSLWGYGQVHGVPSWLVAGARLAVVLVAVGLCALVAVRRPAPDPRRLAALAAALLLAVFLAGRLAEVHFLYAVLPGVGGALGLALPGTGDERQLGRVRAAAVGVLVAPGLALLLWWTPLARQHTMQERFLLAELLLLTGTALAVLPRGRPTPTG